MLRGLLRAPAFALASTGTIALAVCLATTVFAVVDGVLFKPLPYPDAHELFIVGGLPSSHEAAGPLSPGDLQHLHDAYPDSPITTYGGWWVLKHPAAPSVDLLGTRIDAHFFDVLGVRPMMGDLTAEDFARHATDPTPLPAIVSHPFWLRYAGGDPGALGAVVELAAQRIRIAGVLPTDFVLPHRSNSRIDFLFPTPAEWMVRADRWYRRSGGLVRIERGREFEVRARYDAAMASALHEYGPPSDVRNIPYDRVDLRPLAGELGATERPFFALAFAGAALIVLIACVNVTSLMMARAWARSREWRVCSALGASRRDIAGMIGGEVAVLTLCGTALGLALTYPAFALLQNQLPDTVMLLKPPRIDARVAAFAIVAPMTLMLTFALLPLARAFHDAPLSLRSMGATPRTRSWASSSLLALESGIGIAVIVLGAFVLVSFAGLRRAPTGLAQDGLAVVNLELLAHAPTAEGRGELQDRVLASISRTPGVESTAIFGGPLFQSRYSALELEVPGSTQDMRVTEIPVSPAFYDIAGLTLREGRLPTPQEVEDGELITVLTLPAAREMFGDTSAIGRLVKSSSHMYTVIGVVDDVRFATQREGTWGEGFTPISRSERYYATYLFRTRDPLSDVLPRVAQTIARDVPGVLVERAQPFDEAIADTVRLQRFQASLFGVAAAAALLLLSVGVAGIVATSVRRRWREAGIRSALGATSGSIVRLLVADHLRPAALGIAAGLLVSWWAKELLTRLLYELEPSDLRIWTLASATILAVVILAAWWPARRAADADPSLVLRAD